MIHETSLCGRHWHVCISWSGRPLWAAFCGRHLSWIIWTPHQSQAVLDLCSRSMTEFFKSRKKFRDHCSSSVRCTFWMVLLVFIPQCFCLASCQHSLPLFTQLYVPILSLPQGLWICLSNCPECSFMPLPQPNLSLLLFLSNIASVTRTFSPLRPGQTLPHWKSL